MILTNFGGAKLWPQVSFSTLANISLGWAFGTGTALFAKDAADLVCQAIQHGVTHLDRAQMYRNEGTLGAGIKASGEPRSNLFITTKLNGKTLEPGLTRSQSWARIMSTCS